MLTIRLTRKGKKNQPFFRVVVIDKRRSSKGGRAVEELGYVNPLTKKNSLDKERVLHWLKVGAKASPRVHNLLVSEKIIDTPKINVFKVKKSKDAAAAATTAPATPASPPAPAESKAEAAPTVTAEPVSPAPEPEKPVEEPKAETEKPTV